MTEKHDSLAEALAAFQAEMPSVRKGNTAEVPTKAGGKYKYEYADLTDVTEAAMPILAKHGLSFTSSPTMTENGFVLAYRLRHESGEEDAGEYPLPDPGSNLAQTIGSAITYARRYSLCAATGIAPGGDDDDAKAAQDAAPRTTRAPRQTQPSPADTVVAGAEKCSDPAVLDQIEDYAAKQGVNGIAKVKAALEAARTRLGPSSTDSWAPVAVIPGSEATA